jgi:hypothetical protein
MTLLINKGNNQFLKWTKDTEPIKDELCANLVSFFLLVMYNIRPNKTAASILFFIFSPVIPHIAPAI